MFRKSPHIPEILRTAAFAEAAPDSELERLRELSTIADLPAGRVLMRQGAFGNEVLLLISGELLVERDGDPIAVVTPGAVVGEQAVMLNAPRNATVRAATDVSVLAMNRSEFNAVLDECPVIARNILTEAVTRTAA